MKLLVHTFPTVLFLKLSLFSLTSYIAFNIITLQVAEVFLNVVHFAKTIWRSIEEYYRKLKKDKERLVHVLTGKEAGSFGLNKLVVNEVETKQL